MTKIDIFSGFLGAGKTTLIKKLIKESFAGQKVVLIENEFGEIGIDGGFLKESGIQINELNAGCICCSLVGDFRAALQQVVEQYHPDRIVIEPSGVGKLSDVISAVQNAHLDVQLNSFVTVVDALKAKMYLKNFGGILIEAASELPAYWLVGYTTDDEKITVAGESVTLDELTSAFEGKLESVFPTKAAASDEHLTKVSFTERNAAAPAVKSAKPLAVIPVFPGTNCEYDTARAVENAGGAAEIVVVRNFSADALRESAEQLESAIRRAQMVILPGGFSGGDEPDGSGKFIASFLRGPGIKDSIHELLNRYGLMLGICNGFQALIKLGLVPYGEIRDEMTGDDPTLTFNLIGRHQSRYATTRVASVKSPWLSSCNVGDLHSIAFSHGEGRFVAPQHVIDDLAKNGQIAFQYTDLAGAPSMDIAWNPNGSMCAIEGITSPDGRVLGKMGHTERYSPFVGKNIYGEKYQPLFANGVKYFK